MGINAVVIVENSRPVSFEEFNAGLRADKWGNRALDSADNEKEFKSWTEFQWDGKRYFSWVFAPRYPHLHFEDVEGDDPDPGYPAQITFLKIMLTAEKIAGGPVYVGNDVVCKATPFDFPGEEPGFYVPSSLDWLIPNWRKVEDVEIDKPYLVF